MSDFNVDKQGLEEALAGEKPVLIDFWAPWCAPCRAMLPIINEIAEEYPNLRVVKINVDDEPDVTANYKITSVPVIKLFVDGEEKFSVIGMISKDALKERIDSIG